MDLINKIKNKLSGISKKEYVFICVFGIMFVFNYFIFNQFDVILNNQAEFGIIVSEIIWAFVWRSFLIYAIIVCGLIGLRCLSKKGYRYTVAVLFGLILAGYTQVLFMNKEELMALNGTMLFESVGQYIFNSLIYLVIILIPVLLLIFEKKKNRKFTPKLAILLCAVVFGMQSVGLVTASASAVTPAKHNELYYFSIDKQLRLSKNDNIIVFVLDNFDTGIADDVFKKDEKTKDIFEGFTYYKNNISQYPGTFPGVASMLTGEKFDKNTGRQKDYLKSAWADAELFDALHKNGYKVNGLLDTVSTIYDFEDLKDKDGNYYFDNIKKVDTKNRKVREDDCFGAMTSFAQMRQSPDVLKKAFKNKKYLDIANYCVDVKNTPDYFPRTVSADSDLKFYDKLNKIGLSAAEEQNVFSFVHLHASHNPYVYNENLQHIGKAMDKGKKNEAERAAMQTQGTFKILDTYFKQMKELKIYDDSTIIVLGDHGWWKSSNNNIKKELVEAPMTSLFIKTATKNGNSGGALNIDEKNSQLSNGNFLPTIFELIGETEKKPDLSYFDVIQNGGEQTRFFYYIRWVNLNSSTYFWTYQVKGDASKTKNWQKID